MVIGFEWATHDKIWSELFLTLRLLFSFEFEGKKTRKCNEIFAVYKKKKISIPRNSYGSCTFPIAIEII